MIGDWILDDLEELFLRIGGSNRQFVKQLHHKPSETFECPGNTHGRANLDQDPFGGVDVDL